MTHYQGYRFLSAIDDEAATPAKDRDIKVFVRTGGVYLPFFGQINGDRAVTAFIAAKRSQAFQLGIYTTKTKAKRSFLAKIYFGRTLSVTIRLVSDRHELRSRSTNAHKKA